jgi:hypothetical protein
MSHYGYADARPMLEEMGYSTVLYTAQNIDELSSDLTHDRFDAVILASNALNDKTIRDVVASDKFRECFDRFLKVGKGCLVLHQLRLAQTNAVLGFLPKPLDLVRPKERDSDEVASDGNLYLTDIASSNACFLYPHYIEISKVKSQCLSFRGLKGLYWHFFDNVSRSDWDLLLYDVDKRKGERPLVAVCKESEPFRIVLCALTIDWQKQKTLLRNILTYVVEGKHNTAVVRDLENVSVTFNYFVECLKSDKYPFRIYDVQQNLSDFVKNIQAGVHTIVILDPFVDKRKLGNEVFSLIQKQVQDGKVKLIGIDSDVDLRRFYVAGKERYALRLLHDLEMRLQKELYSDGYIDGSFWSTVESLQILKGVPDVRSDFDEQTLQKTFAIANNHDRNGSYDEVFGATCALLWLRARYLGKNHRDTERTLAWIRKNVQNYEDRERALAYYTLVNVDTATKDEKESLRRLVLAQKVDQLSEIDLVAYLRAAVAIRAEGILPSIIRRLEDKQENGCWIDLATSATAVAALLDALALVRQHDQASYAKTAAPIESMIFKTIIYIQNSRKNMSEEKGVNYPWDNKASTSLKCIQAWLEFEKLMDLPVHEILDTLSSYSNVETSKSSTRTAIAILEEIKQENRKLAEDKRRLSTKVAKDKASLRLNRILWVLLLSTLYVLLSLTIYSLRIGVDSPMSRIIEGTFFEQWIFHLTFLTLLVTIFGIFPLWKRRQEGPSAND